MLSSAFLSCYMLDRLKHTVFKHRFHTVLVSKVTPDFTPEWSAARYGSG